MNIFEIFCAGDGRINEPNMTSALHFLLDPKEPHGLRISALNEFLAPIANEIRDLAYPLRDLNGNAEHLLSQFLGSLDRIELTVEEAVFNPDKASTERRDIDLIIRLFSGAVSPHLVIAIENKIAVGSAAGVQQLSDEYHFLREKIREDYPQFEGQPEVRIPIIFIYLTPDALKGTAIKQWDGLNLPTKPEKEIQDFKVQYQWKPLTENSGSRASISDVAKTILRKEQEGMINPASSHTSLFLRSMIKFIDNNFYFEQWDNPSLERLSNNKQEMDQDEFWRLWLEQKKGSLSLAQRLFKLYEREFERIVSEKGGVKPDVVSTRTRIAFFQDRNRPVAIMLQSPTTNGRVEIQVKQGSGEGFLALLESFKNQYKVDFKMGGPNFLIQVPIDISETILEQLVRESLNQLA